MSTPYLEAGQILYKARKAQAVNQDVIADALYVNRHGYYRMELGRKRPDTKEARALFTVLDLSQEDRNKCVDCWAAPLMAELGEWSKLKEEA